MATIVDYQYIPEVSTLDALHNLASDTTNGYSQDLPGVNTFLINGANQVTNIPEGEGGLGIAGWSTNVRWTAGVGTISWTSGDINLPDGSQISISSGSANVTANTYLYVDTESGTIYSTTQSYEAVGENKIMICAAFPNSGKNVTFKAFGCADQSSLTTGADIATGTIVASNIASNTITASQIASGTITANEIAGNTITASEIASGAITTAKISSGAVTASKIDVSELSAITANLGDVHVGATSGSGAGIRIYPNSSTDGRMDFYYNGNMMGRIVGGNYSGVGNAVLIYGGTGGGTIGLLGTTICVGKLKIPVGTNLYE